MGGERNLPFFLSGGINRDPLDYLIHFCYQSVMKKKAKSKSRNPIAGNAWRYNKPSVVPNKKRAFKNNPPKEEL